MSSQIRTRFVEHMEVYGLTQQTQRSYISGVKGLSGVCHISAEQHHR